MNVSHVFVTVEFGPQVSDWQNEIKIPTYLIKMMSVAPSNPAPSNAVSSDNKHGKAVIYEWPSNHLQLRPIK